MTDLLEAAKAVIDCYDRHWPIQTSLKVKKLRAAVERADKPPADFMVWWKTFPLNTYGIVPAFHGWEAGQQAERERIKEIVGELLDPKDPWIHYSTLLEKIDGLDGI